MDLKSSKPSKQRKALYNAPIHLRRKLLSCHLSTELRAKYNTRAFPVRVGDTVKVLRGDFKGIEGKVTEVDTKNISIYIEGVTREKVSGTTVKVPIHPSKVMITNLNLEDKLRIKALERKKEEIKAG
ncbi:MAG: 50S ribosomal protein L24 [Candidatus Bathyarchaeia archaeon]